MSEIPEEIPTAYRDDDGTWRNATEPVTGFSVAFRVGPKCFTRLAEAQHYADAHDLPRDLISAVPVAESAGGYEILYGG